MTTFDLVQIQEFVAHLDSRMGPGLNGASESHAALATALRDHAELCHEFIEKVLEWRRAIFSGRIDFDPAVESVVRAEGTRLSARAEELQDLVAEAKAANVRLEGSDTFQTNVDRMNRLFNPWLRPQLAVGPGPRHWRHVTPEMIEEARRRIEALPPLPADWLPDDPEQRARFQKLRNP